jgi:curved DNA-binding protein CbpA
VAHCEPVTRESIPRFDLYAELEVSPSATVAVIEAAYRKLAKQHHPDVATRDGSAPTDGDRIKRLNVAREWLTQPDRRDRYDRAMGHVPGAREPAKPASSARSTRSRPRPRTSGRSSRKAEKPVAAAAAPEPTEAATFGVNSDRVRQFLADLRALDEARALQLRAGRFSVIHPDYPAARERMLELGRERRDAETNLAREAAAVIVRGKVGDPHLADEIATVASDIAGAITLRDLLPRDDFELLLAPWTWRGGRIESPSNPQPATKASRSRAPGGAKERTRSKASAVKTPKEPDWPQADLLASVVKSDDAPPPSISPPGRPPRPTWPAPRGRRRSILSSPTAAAGAGLAAVVLIALVGVLAFGNPAPGAIADTGSPTPEPTSVAGAETDNPNPNPTPAPTSTPPMASPPSASPTPAIDPALALELQRGAAEALDELNAATAAGDLAAVRRLTGGTAPGVRRSGLAATSFPDSTTSEIVVAADGDGWLATVGDDTLRSVDGISWTFDYGDRPLAVFAGTPEHDLFWLEPRHDLFLRVVDATVTRTEVRIRFEWNYPDTDAGFLDAARLWLSSLAIGNQAVDVGRDLDIGLAERAVTFAMAGQFRGSTTLSLVAAVSPPTRFTNHSAFELSTR